MLVAAVLVAGCGLTMIQPAAAQGRHRGRSAVIAASAHRRGPIVRTAVVVGPGAWGPWGPWGPFWPPYYPPYPPYPPYPYYYGTVDDSAHLKTDVKPKEARVYVDGYYAGTVDDFDGVFQNLRLEPGAHDVTLYLDGYRTITRRLYLGPDSTFKLSARLEPLRSGEVSEPPPAPRQPMPTTPGRPTAPPPLPGVAQPPAPPEPPPAGIPGPPGVPAAPPTPAEPGAQAQGFGAVAIQVQPADAEISIDGEPWRDGAGEQPLVVQLAAGPHTIDIRKAGYRSFSVHVEVQDGETTPINVRLPPIQ
jgi:hypothetical protein